MVLSLLALATLLPQEDAKARAELVSARTFVRPGELVTLGVRIQTEPGWHVYYRNAGDSGEPTAIKWNLPKGWKAGETLWPAPSVFSQEGLVTYGYEGEAFLLNRVQVPKNARKGSVRLAADVQWLVCKDVCLEGSAQVNLPLQVSSAIATNKVWQPKLAKVYEELPREDRNWQTLGEATPNGYVLTVTPPASYKAPSSDFLFISSRPSVVEHTTSHPVTARKGSFMIHLNKSEYAVENAMRLTGVLLVPEEAFPKALKIDVPLQYR